MCHHGQALHVQDSHLTTVNANDAVFLHFIEAAANGFDSEAKITADILSAHG